MPDRVTIKGDLLGRKVPTGDHFNAIDPAYTLYVDKRHDRGDHGRERSRAMKYITDAIEYVNTYWANVGATIMVAPGFYVEPDGIEIEVNDVQLIGTGLPEATVLLGSGTTFGTVAEGDAPCLTISGGNCRIFGMSIHENSTSYPAITIAGEGGGYKGGFNIIENCYFPVEVAYDRPKYAIEFEAGAGNIIQDCYIEGCGTAGIYFGSTSSNHPTRNTIRRNTFRGTEIGILLNAHCYSTIIDSNIFLSGDQGGDTMVNAIITGGAANGDIMICRNIFEQAATSDYDIDETLGSAVITERDNTAGG